MMLLLVTTIFASGADDSEEVKKIGISILSGGDALGHIEKAIEKIEAKYPNVVVRQIHVAANVMKENMASMVAVGDAPDIYMDYMGRVSTYISEDYALDLTPYLDADDFVAGSIPF